METQVSRTEQDWHDLQQAFIKLLAENSVGTKLVVNRLSGQLLNIVKKQDAELKNIQDGIDAFGL
jgi:hypothetical protein